MERSLTSSARGPVPPRSPSFTSQLQSRCRLADPVLPEAALTTILSNARAARRTSENGRGEETSGRGNSRTSAILRGMAEDLFPKKQPEYPWQLELPPWAPKAKLTEA